MRKTTSGFTIVELLIVIVVIAILAAITIVAYNGIQARASDSRILAGVNQVEKALKLWSADNGSAIKGGLNSTVASGGSACTDGQNGWFGSGSYICTVEDTLVAAKLLPSGFSQKLPANTYYSPGSGGRLALMFYSCAPAGAGKWAIYWTLQAPTASDLTSLDDTLSACSNSPSIRDTWGMKAGKIVQL